MLAVRNHTEIGYNLLKDSNWPLIKTAALIASDHHEYWKTIKVIQDASLAKVFIYFAGSPALEMHFMQCGLNAATKMHGFL
jgi:hypothetical protein